MDIFSRLQELLSVAAKLNLITKEAYVHSLTLLINKVFTDNAQGPIMTHVRSARVPAGSQS